MRQARFPIPLASALAVLGLFACRPVLAIGWGELAAIAAIIALLLGPLMFRLARSWIKFQESIRKERDSK